MSQDTKRLILVMMLVLGLTFAWQGFMRWYYRDWYEYQARKALEEQQAKNQSQPQTQSSTQPSTQPGTTQPGTAPTAPSIAPGGWHARGANASATARPAALGSAAVDDPKYAMAVDVVQKGAAIDSVILNSYRKIAEDKTSRYTFQTPYPVDNPDRTRAFLTRKVNVDGADIELTNVFWRIESSDVNSATFSIDVLQADRVIGKIFKVYQLSGRTTDPNSPLGYQLNVIHRFQNLIDRPVTFKATINGPATPPKELESQPDQNLIGGYWNDGEITVESHLIMSEFGKATWLELTKSNKSLPLVWAGTQSAYFEAIVRPVPWDPKQLRADYIYKLAGEVTNPAEQDPEKRHILPYFETGAITVAPGQTQSIDFEVYLGPKGRAVLNVPYYANLPRDYDQTLVIIGGMCAICTWQWLINVLVWMLTLFKGVTQDWGLAIIILVFIVRALLHPITKKSQVHMMKMQKFAPELEKLKKKYGDNKEELAKAQVAFYKEQGLGPILGCLPMFLQMPIWIALWNALQSTFELRHAPFLYGLTWIDDMSKPDHLLRFSQTYKLWFLHISGLNLLPILLAVVFYVQTKYFTPKPPSMTPEQQQQQKIMTWMTTLMFPLLLYSGPSGLNVYILASTAFGIIESKIIRDHIKQREALEAIRGPTIVDAPPVQKGSEKGKKGEESGRKKGWFERLQEKAEQARREAQRRDRKR